MYFFFKENKHKFNPLPDKHSSGAFLKNVDKIRLHRTSSLFLALQSLTDYVGISDYLQDF